jgi:mannose-6-phosphate isomerase
MLNKKIINKPWGYEKIWAESPNYLGKVLVINPGQKLSRQYHNYKEETFMVLNGILSLEIGKDDSITTFHLREGESYHCSPGTIHRMINDIGFNTWEVKVLEVSTNPDGPEDIVRLEDDYKR